MINQPDSLKTISCHNASFVIIMTTTSAISDNKIGIIIHDTSSWFSVSLSSPSHFSSDPVNHQTFVYLRSISTISDHVSLSPNNDPIHPKHAQTTQTYLKIIENIRSCHDANFVVTGGTAGCLYDNLQCRQWQQSWHHDNSPFSLQSNKHVYSQCTDVKISVAVVSDKFPGQREKSPWWRWDTSISGRNYRQSSLQAIILQVKLITSTPEIFYSCILITSQHRDPQMCCQFTMQKKIYYIIHF